MGLLNKIKDAAKEAVEKSKLAEQQKKENVIALTNYVNDHIQEFKEKFVESEGAMIPIKSALIFGVVKYKEELEGLVRDLDYDRDASTFTESYYYIDTEIGRIFLEAGNGLINLKPKHPSEFAAEKARRENEKKQAEIDAIISNIKAMPNPDSSEVMDRIKYCCSELIKEDDEEIAEAWKNCVLSLIKSLPNPSPTKHMEEIRQCYSEYKKDIDSEIRSAWKERICLLIDLLEIPSAENAMRIIQEYGEYEKQYSNDYRISEAWAEKKKVLLDYAKHNYMDEPSVKQYFTRIENETNITKKAKLYEALAHVGCLILTILFFCTIPVLGLIILAGWVIAAIIYKKHFKSKYVKPE